MNTDFEINKREKKAGEEAAIFLKEKNPDRISGEVGTGRRFMSFLLDYIIILALFLVLSVFTGLRGDDADFLAVLVLLSYFFLFEVTINRTPGKIISGIIVVTKEGRKPSVGRIIGRTLCRLVPLDAISFLIGANWHDKLSGTKVIAFKQP